MNRSPKKLSLVVTDIEHTCRRGVIALCNSHSRLRVVGEARSVIETRALCRRLQPDLLLIDPGIEAEGGLAFIKEMRCASGALRIVAFARATDAATVQRAIRAGAHGFVSRLDEGEELLKVLLAVSDGRIQLSPLAAAGVFDGLANGAVAVAGEVGRLSNRERQVFALIGEGRKTQEVATLLGVSVKTVESHLEHMKVKLGVRSGAALRRMAASANLEAGR